MNGCSPHCDGALNICMHACRLVRSGEIKYKIKGVVGVRGMLRANLRHTQQLHVSPHVEGAAPLACRAVG